jgi:tetratricopeptide (TPR) repeat protein
MKSLLLSALMAVAALAAGPVYELTGHIQPAGVAEVSLFGTDTPFRDATLSNAAGKFTFKKIEAGTYSVAVFFSARGLARRTVEIGPGTADEHRRVNVNLEFENADFFFADAVRRRHSISARQLGVPHKALHDYDDAQKELARHETDSAVKSLEHTVALAPQFAAAWNELGTIAYRTGKFERAEQCFRRALDQDPQAFEPLVNLGGVLVTLRRTAEALDYNLRAALAQPRDVPANSQLGQAYFQAGNYDLALKYLERARQIDPTHYSHPQLYLAEIHSRRGDRPAAAADLEDFLKHHPDWPQAAALRQAIAALRR